MHRPLLGWRRNSRHSQSPRRRPGRLGLHELPGHQNWISKLLHESMLQKFICGSLILESLFGSYFDDFTDVATDALAV